MIRSLLISDAMTSYIARPSYIRKQETTKQFSLPSGLFLCRKRTSSMADACPYKADPYGSTFCTAVQYRYFIAIYYTIHRHGVLLFSASLFFVYLKNSTRAVFFLYTLSFSAHALLKQGLCPAYPGRVRPFDAAPEKSYFSGTVLSAQDINKHLHISLYCSCTNICTVLYIDC